MGNTKKGLIPIKIVNRLLALAGAALMLGSLALMTSCNKIEVVPNVPFEFPCEDHIELTWYYGYDDTYFTGDFTALEDHPYMKRREEATNVHVKYQVPTADSLEGGRAEIETMLASGTLTDMVTQAYFGLTLEGPTLDSVIDEGIYLDLDDYIDIQMPNFNKLREEYSIIDKVITTTYGNVVYIPMISGIENLNRQRQTGGLVIRKDFLDELQLQVPVTIDDWYNVLTAFKVKKGLETPLSIGSLKYAASMGQDVIITAYDARYEWYLDRDKKIAYGATSEGVKNYVTTMSRWVAEGLAVANDLTAEQRSSDDVGAWVGGAQDIMTCKQNASNPDYELVACPDPVVNVGDKITCRGSSFPLGSSSRMQVYLSAECSQPAVACKWLDLFFTTDSFMESSYGVEGEDYNKDADGNITFTDKIKNNPDGIRYGIEQNAYLNSFWHDADVIINYTYTEAANAACDVWSQSTNEYSFDGAVLQFTPEESESLASLNGFWGQQQDFLKGMVLGNRELTDWDEFVTNMNNIGLEDYIAIYQQAYDRYLAS